LEGVIVQCEPPVNEFRDDEDDDIVWVSPSEDWFVSTDRTGRYYAIGTGIHDTGIWSTLPEAVDRCVRGMDETTETTVQYGTAIEALVEHYRRRLIRGRPATVLHLYRQQINVEANTLLDGERCLTTDACPTARRRTDEEAGG
jgi:hypothetical protein